MRFVDIAVLVIFSSVQTIIVASEIDPENYVAKEVPTDIARGGIQKMHDSGILHFGNEFQVESETNLKNRNLQNSFLRRNLDDNAEQNNIRDLGGQPQQPPIYYDDNYDDDSYDDDQVITETAITIEFYQDNRFSNPEPVLSNAANPTREASGNRWLYANVPLQPIFGINDLPIEGLVQGFCSGIKEDKIGFCHFTYEFFDLQDGAIVVYASLTVEGSTNPQGPSTLIILGGTGEFADAVGEATLWPVNIDENVLPSRIFRDGSFFLGNRNGYEVKFDVSVRSLANPKMVIPAPTVSIVSAPVSAPLPQDGAEGFAPRVICPGQIESEYCDCAMDCQATSARCSCSDAIECCNTQ